MKCFGEGERGWIAKFTRKVSMDAGGCQYFCVIVLIFKQVLRGSDWKGWGWGGKVKLEHGKWLWKVRVPENGSSTLVFGSRSSV